MLDQQVDGLESDLVDGHPVTGAHPSDHIAVVIPYRPDDAHRHLFLLIERHDKVLEKFTEFVIQHLRNGLHLLMLGDERRKRSEILVRTLFLVHIFDDVLVLHPIVFFQFGSHFGGSIPRR